MSTYMITDGHGNQLCDGVSELDRDNVGQRWADRLGATVYAYSNEPHETPGHTHAPYPYEPAE